MNRRRWLQAAAGSALEAVGLGAFHGVAYRDPDPRRPASEPGVLRPPGALGLRTARWLRGRKGSRSQ